MSWIYGSLANEEMGNDASNWIEKKRDHQCSSDTSDQVLYSNKKQAVESANEKPASGAEIMNMSLLGNTSSCQSSQTGKCLFRPKPIRISNFEDKNISLMGDRNVIKKSFADQVEIDSPICLSMSRDEEDSLHLGTGGRKVKVNQVISENHLSEFVGKSCNPRDKNKMISSIHGPGNDMSFAPMYNPGGGSATLVNTAFGQTDKNFISLGLVSNKRSDGDFMGYHDKWMDNSHLSIDQAFNKNFYYRSYETPVAMDSFYNKANESYMSAGPTYDKEGMDVTSVTSIHGQQDATISSLGTVYSKGNSSFLSMGQSHNKGNSNNIHFGGFHDNGVASVPSVRLLSNWDPLLNQSSAQSSFVKCPSINSISSCTSMTGSGPKKKEQKTTKKVPSNKFPANVKILLSTGILEGVPVKYISWSRDKSLRGVIKGTGYLCGCKECNLSEPINAYDFERHAGCKTRHPNTHIYFESGKSIHAVVQELKSTPQDMLFVTIENVTGSPVNQEKFNTWKAAYQAASLDLQPINAKDEVVMHPK